MSIVSKKIKKYGFWPSGLSAANVAGKNLKFAGLATMNGCVYWTESRPDDGGRATIVKRDVDGQLSDMFDAPFNAASKVHEYGGGEFGLSADYLVFVNAKDQDLYKIDLARKSPPQRLTNISNMRFGDIQIYGDEIVAVAELHDPDAAVSNMPENLLVRLPLTADMATEIEIIAPSKLYGGRDFYAYPRVSPCGKKLVYMAWDLPHMPWQCAELFMADIGADGVKNVELIAGGGDEAIFAPIWHTDGGQHGGALYYVGDGTGIGNLYERKRGSSTNLLPIEAECGHPNWVFNMRSYDVLDNGLIVLRLIEQGIFKLVVIEPWSQKTRYLETDFVHIEKIAAYGDHIVMFASTDEDAEVLVSLNIDTGDYEIIRKTSQVELAEGDVSKGEMIKYKVGDDIAYALYYPPANGSFKAADGELPPILVKAHGGPTSLADRGFKIARHYWTTRGFAIVDLDYRGSFGYGRDYMQKLDGNWGVTDVEDAVAAVEYLSSRGQADANKAFISGGSAGGFTVLMALANSEAFLAGTSYYGVADLGGLAKATHKFELKYMDELVGLPDGLTDEQAQEFYLSKSPLSMLDDYKSPTLFLQGLDDKVVPPAQSQAMYDVLKAKNVRTKLIKFTGEGHGFKKAENNITSLEEELKFYQDLMA
ncbi:MAG: S9 family peptidase [Rhizobiales bacterium]|nr:prolyl oligopeptidase family serine peptidase [Hyphomicrobiales bacterium]NRB14731.1 S9 family peptidase [Hyphomicrobiales bacterium]